MQDLSLTPKKTYRKIEATKTRKIYVNVKYIMNLKQQDWSNYKIAKELKVSEIIVRRRLKEYENM
ncbi:MAG TPA: hypothetical protein VK091_05885 [Virgibacillus sp.]|nr:hypothetical protein [Virgibacillus sp.]